MNSSSDVDEERGSKFGELWKDLKEIMEYFYINEGPSYGNSFWFQIGFYIIVLGVVLGITGGIMMFFGPYWWNYSIAGIYISQIHFWSAELLITLLILHLFVNFSTSSFKKRKDQWVIGVLMLFFALITYAFGIGLNNNVVAQYNDKSGAGLWNSLLLGWLVNPENFGAVLGWHVIIIPGILAVLVLVHFLLAWKRGLTKPHRPDVKYSVVKLDHKKMFIRAGAIVAIAIILGVVLAPLWYNPFIPALDAQWASQHYPDDFASTLLEEYNYTSGTATYSKFTFIGPVNPYNYSWDNITYINTREVYVIKPYSMLINSTNDTNYLSIYMSEPKQEQINQLNYAYEYFKNNGSIIEALNNKSNPIEVVAAQLTLMAQSGLYDGALTQENWDHSSLDQTFEIRLMTDMGLIHEVEGEQYKLYEGYWGMIKFNIHIWQFGSYWLAPYDALEYFGDHISWWHSLYNEMIALVFFLIVLFLPWIPGVRNIPDYLRLYKLFWNKYTIPEMRKDEKKRK